MIERYLVRRGQAFVAVGDNMGIVFSDDMGETWYVVNPPKANTARLKVLLPTERCDRLDPYAWNLASRTHAESNPGRRMRQQHLHGRHERWQRTAVSQWLRMGDRDAWPRRQCIVDCPQHQQYVLRWRHWLDLYERQGRQVHSASAVAVDRLRL